MRQTIGRVARAGVAAAVLVAAAGWALGRARFGTSDEAALARIQAELSARFDASATALGQMAALVAGDQEIIRSAARDQAAAAQLFAAIEQAIPEEDRARTGLTVYD